MEDDNKAAALAKLFGGTRPLAKAIGVSPALVHRWVTWGRKTVPGEYRDRIIVAAGEALFDKEEMADLLSLLPPVCECCGQELRS